MRTTTKKPKFKVGDEVVFHYGVSTVNGIMVEDRGEIGVGGRRLYRVEFGFDDVQQFIELPESDLQPYTAEKPNCLGMVLHRNEENPRRCKRKSGHGPGELFCITHSKDRKGYECAICNSLVAVLGPDGLQGVHGCLVQLRGREAPRVKCKCGKTIILMEGREG